MNLLDHNYRPWFQNLKNGLAIDLELTPPSVFISFSYLGRISYLQPVFILPLALYDTVKVGRIVCPTFSILSHMR